MNALLELLAAALVYAGAMLLINMRVGSTVARFITFVCMWGGVWVASITLIKLTTRIW